MHTLQKLLIKRLVEENGRTYSSLTKNYDSEDNIAFHLKQLVGSDLVEKKEDRYFITAKGINTLNEFQKTDLQDNTFKMFFVGFVCNCGDEYLIKPHRNAKEIFYNLPSGSPLFGESLQDALPRIFYEETDLHISYNSYSFDSLHMKTVKTKEGATLFDDAFGVYKILISDTEKTKMDFKKGSEWVRLQDIGTLPNKWPEIDMCILQEAWNRYSEYTVVCDYVLR